MIIEMNQSLTKMTPKPKTRTYRIQYSFANGKRSHLLIRPTTSQLMITEPC